MMPYRIFTDATADLTPELLQGLPPVEIIPMQIEIGGRVSAAAAVMGTALQIKPLIHVDLEGRLQVAGKPRGSKKALTTLVEKMEQGWAPELGKQVFVAHGDNPEAVHQLRERIAERFPDAEIFTAEIGPVIGAHTGPGMLALLYWGKNR